uniref:hypothetical protein n=1 Tax=Flavobacterium croceum TaxID=370975 RepID=UPI0024A854F3
CSSDLYHPFDLLEREALVEQQNRALKQVIKKIPKNIFVLFGGFEKNKSKKRRSGMYSTTDKLLPINHNF